MAPAEYLMAEPGERILDLCAAPGGKSTQIACSMQGEGLIVCNEIHPARAKILSENIERMGVCNALVTNETPQKLCLLYTSCNLIVVFDAYRVKGHQTEMLDHHNIHVVYTKEAETADALSLIHMVLRRYVGERSVCVERQREKGSYFLRTGRKYYFLSLIHICVSRGFLYSCSTAVPRNCMR